MNREDAKNFLKDKLEDYLHSKGINPRKSFNCLSPDHNDESPSMSYYKGGKNVHCFGCDASYDIFDLIGLDYGLTEYNDQLKKACELYGVSLDNTTKETNEAHRSQRDERDRPKITTLEKSDTITPAENYEAYFKECANRIEDTDYLIKRGISYHTARKFNIGYDPNYTKSTGGNQWGAVIIPTSPNSYVARNTNQEATANNRVRKTGQNLNFNSDVLFTSEKPIVIVEGEIDALSIVEAGGEAIGLGGTGNANKLIKQLEDAGKKPKAPLIIALDNDEAGSKASDKLEEELKRLNVSYLRRNLYGHNKDANDALTGNRKYFQGQIEEVNNIGEDMKDARIKAYKKNSAGQHLQAFINGITDSVNTPVISTGFEKLDELLDGGLYEGLYTCGAISSLGKTTLVLQIADQIAKAGHEVLIFSLEMARSELMAKSISRHTILEALERGLDTGNAKTVRGITNGAQYAKYSDEEKELIQIAIKAYSTYADNIYIYEGIGDIGVQEIKERVKEHVTITGNTPVVVIDYAQILAPADIRASDKQNTDKAVTELKRLSRDFKTPVIAISSFNRESYKNAVTMSAFKESGAIEYGSDVLIGLQLKGAGTSEFDVDEAKTRNPREVELKILKQRNGATSGTVDFEYFPMFNYFREQKKRER